MQIENGGQNKEYIGVEPNLHPQACYLGSNEPILPSHKKALATCNGCGKVVCDSSFLLVENLAWHVTCLKCCVCLTPLDKETTCFVRNGNVYCRNDYHKNFLSRSCASCRVMIQSHELVMRVRGLVYHADEQCFSCNRCERPLVTGEKFAVGAGTLACWNCFQSDSRHENRIYNVTTNKSGRPKKRKRKNLPISDHMTSLQLNMGFGNVITSERGVTNQVIFSDQLNSAHERSAYSNQKSKRIRTSFKHNQLSTMKEYFDSNQNPDNKDLKKLAQKTGLTKRVLQVWFQNARAKYRRNRQQSKIKTERQNCRDPCLESKSSYSATSPSGGEESPASANESEAPKTFRNESETVLLTSYRDYKNSYSNGILLNCSTSDFKCTLSPFGPMSSSSTPPLTSSKTSPSQLLNI